MAAFTTTSCSVLAAPSPALTSAPRSSLEQQPRAYDPMDEFFGYRFGTAGTSASRHDTYRSRSASFERDFEALPAYAEHDASLPAYAEQSEPVTLAMYLFKFGFLCPIFWILGAIVLVSPLHAPPVDERSPSWMLEKTETEREAYFARLRRAELKWGRRCFMALLTMITLVLVVALATWAVLRK